MSALRIETAPAFAGLLGSHRFKGASGGRGAAKSHFAASAYVEDTLLGHVRAACVREVQNSIKDSVKQLIEDKIRAFGVDTLFKCTEREIVGPNDSLFVFRGLQSYNATSIKSLEGFNRCWVEEAQSISQHSLDILTPTFRSGSQMMFTWNPTHESDPIERMFLENTGDPDFVHVRVNYADNPWFPAELRRDMERDRRRDPEKYQHVWLGAYQRRSHARVFHNWRVETFDTPANARFYLGADWGFAIDPTVLIRCFIVEGQKHFDDGGRLVSQDTSKLFIDYEAWEVGCEIDATPRLFDTVPGSRKWPIIADSANPQSISYMQRHGFDRIEASIKGVGSVEEGVEFLKSYDIIVHPRCRHAVDELGSYSYEIDKKTNEVLPKLADKKNHCIAEGSLVTCKRGDIPIEQVCIGDEVLTRNGFNTVLFAGQTDADRETVLVQTSVGTVRCTPDHEIYTLKGFRRADTLRYGDEVIGVTPSWLNDWNGAGKNTADTRRASGARIGSTFAEAPKAAALAYIAMCGNFITAQFQRATTFIISMAILQTTPLRTLPAYRQSSITASTYGAMSGARSRPNISPAYGRSRKRGTSRKKVRPSIAKLAEWLIRISFPSRSRANSAERDFCHEPSVTEIGSVVTPASLPIVGHLASMTSKSSALSAGKSSRRTSTAKYELVHGHVLAVSPGKHAGRVFDLTVESNHEFFADGVLVHNCIDSIRYAIELIRRSSYDDTLSWVGGPALSNTPTEDWRTQQRVKAIIESDPGWKYRVP